MHEAFGSDVAHRFQTDAHFDRHLARGRADRFELCLPAVGGFGRPEANLAEFLGKFPGEEIEQLLRLGGAGRVFDAGVNVFRVLAEDHHVHFFRMPDRRGYALEPANRTKTDEQVEHLAQRHVQRADAAADRRRERTFDPHQIFSERVDGLVGQPVVELLEALLSGVDLHPRDLAFAAVRVLHSGVEHAHARAPDVGARSVAFDERDDRIVGHSETPVAMHDGRAGRRCQRTRVRHRTVITFRSGPPKASRDSHRNCGKVCGKDRMFTAL